MLKSILLSCVIIFLSTNFNYSQIQVSGEITSNTTWNTFTGDNVYVITGDVSVPNGITLTIQAGVIIKFRQYRALKIYGTLDVQGTSSNKVVFTSFQDDSFGGDTNGDLNATQPIPGDWGRIYFESQPGITNTFDYCIVKYGGFYFEGSYSSYCGNIDVSSSNVTYSDVNIQNCEINKSSYAGIRVMEFAQPNIINCDIVQNQTYGLENTTGLEVIAENNFWGDLTGPYHQTLNPNGLGNTVSDNVDFIPFALEPINYINYLVNIRINPAYYFETPEFYGHNDPIGNVIVQNKIAFEIEIYSTIHYDPPLQDLNIQVLLDGQPMSLVLQSQYANLDVNGDGIIDRLPSSWRPNLDYIKFLAVSNDIYTENQLAKNITAKILSINGQVINNLTEEVLDYYFAKNLTNGPFRENIDGYGFDNGLPLNFSDFNYYMSEIPGLPFIGLLSFIFEYFDGTKARCYGMAATSGTYFVDALRKPLTGIVNSFPVNNYNVQDNINRSHLSQDYYSIFMGDNQDLNSAYQLAKNELIEQRPVVFGFSEPGFFGGKHSILATSLSFFHNKNLAGIRVYENEDYNNAWSTALDFNQQKFIHPIEPTWNKLLSIPYNIYSNWDFGYYFNQALSNIIQQFFNLGKKGYSVACPVYLLVKNTSGQKSGYTAEGIFINEIPNAEVKRIPTHNTSDDSITIVYVPASDNYTTEINAYNSGQMLVETMKPETETTLTTSSFDSIEVTNQTICYYNDTEPGNLLIDEDGDGNIDTTIVVTPRIITDVADDKVVKIQIPSEYNLTQNYPNPFNPSTTISYSLPKKSYVTLKIYNLLGEELKILVNEEKPAGFYEMDFNASDLPSGVYLYKLQAGDFVQTKKMILLK